MEKLLTVISILCLCGCAGIKYMTPTGYLGIPNQEQCPGKAIPISAIENKYYAISKVETVSYDDYQWHKERDQIKYEVRRGNTIYFSTEEDADFEIEPGIRDYVIILKRKKTKINSNKMKLGEKK